MQADGVSAPAVRCTRCGVADRSSALTGVIVDGCDHGRLCLACFELVMREEGERIARVLRGDEDGVS